VTDTKRRQRVDGLSVGLLLAAVAFLLISVPATYNAALISTHYGVVGAVLRVFVLELLAFGAKVGTRYFPEWEKPLDWFAILMLSITTLINFADEWTALWRPEVELGLAWGAIRDFALFGVPVGAVLMAFVWSALAPTGVYFALTFWTKRQRQLEALENPETLVDRRLGPLIVEMEVQERFDERLLGLLAQRQRRYQMVTGPVYEAEPSAPAPVFELGEAIRRFSSPEAAFEGLQRTGELPNGLTYSQFVALYETQQKGPTNERACSACGKELTAGEYGVAVKYARKHQQPVRCTECRHQLTVT
jgi:DNA-directed RNA polymerase subunit RPC12/RpoP